MTPEIVERDQHSISLRIECPNSEDIYLNIQLGPWETQTDAEPVENGEEKSKENSESEKTLQVDGQ